jgi:hypothetical protein
VGSISRQGRTSIFLPRGGNFDLATNVKPRGRRYRYLATAARP